jgi:transcription initiation factor IIE alpha subunit
MTPRELERLEKDSIYTFRLNSDLRDQIINTELNELNKTIKKNIKQKKIVVFVVGDIN